MSKLNLQANMEVFAETITYTYNICGNYYDCKLSTCIILIMNA